MQEEIMYRVCPLRNVPAAFQRFLGPDSGGFERFFPDQRMQRVDGTLLIVRLRGRKAVNGARYELQRAARATSHAIAGASQAIAVGKDAALLIARTAVLLFALHPVRLPI